MSISRKDYGIGDIVEIRTFYERYQMFDGDGEHKEPQEFEYDYKYFHGVKEYPLALVISEKPNFGQTMVKVRMVESGDILECYWYDVKKI